MDAKVTKVTSIDWWSRATTSRRLSQIDGGIELGMSAEHIAICSGTDAETIEKFALQHNRHI